MTEHTPNKIDDIFDAPDEDMKTFLSATDEEMLKIIANESLDGKQETVRLVERLSCLREIFDAGRASGSKDAEERIAKDIASAVEEAIQYINQQLKDVANSLQKIDEGVVAQAKYTRTVCENMRPTSDGENRGIFGLLRLPHFLPSSLEPSGAYYPIHPSSTHEIGWNAIGEQCNALPTVSDEAITCLSGKLSPELPSVYKKMTRYG